MQLHSCTAAGQLFSYTNCQLLRFRSKALQPYSYTAVQLLGSYAVTQWEWAYSVLALALALALAFALALALASASALAFPHAEGIGICIRSW